MSILGGLLGGDSSSSTVSPASTGLGYSGNIGGTVGYQTLQFSGQVKNSPITIQDTAALAEVNNLANLIAGENDSLNQLATIAMYAALAYGALRVVLWVME